MRADGVADVEALERALSATPPGASTLVALTRADRVAWCSRPSASVVRRAAGGDTLYMLDACQAGILPLDVKRSAATSSPPPAARAPRPARHRLPVRAPRRPRARLAPRRRAADGRPHVGALDVESVVRGVHRRLYDVGILDRWARRPCRRLRFRPRGGGRRDRLRAGGARAAELRRLDEDPGADAARRAAVVGAAAEAAGARRCATSPSTPRRRGPPPRWRRRSTKRIGAPVSPSFHTFDDAQGRGRRGAAVAELLHDGGGDR